MSFPTRRVDPQQRRYIIRSCKSRGWTLHPEALASIEEALEEVREDSMVFDTNDAVARILDGVRPYLKGGRTVTEQVWNDWVEASQQQAATTTTTTTSQKRTSPRSTTSSLQVVQAFQTPKLIFQGMRRQFQIEDLPTGSLFGTADDKIDMLAQRYALVHQRVLRHEIFRPSSDWYPSATGKAKITPIESLLGQKTGGEGQVVLLLGILLQIEQGAYYLEDPTGQVPISLQHAEPTDASFLTEHSIVLVEGSVCDGTVHVHRIGQPLQETRVDALRSIQQQVSHPAFMLPRRSDTKDDSTFCIFQDVHMDQPRVLQQLESALAHHEHRCTNKPQAVVFVFMGNFCSPHALQTAAPTPAARHQLVKTALDELVTLVLKFPALSAQAQFVIVPGPRDTGNRVWPIPSFSELQVPPTTGVTHWHWASNPCRLRWNNREMVVFRHDLLPLLLSHQIRLPSEFVGRDDDDEETAHHVRASTSRLLKTVLDQGTLMPLTSVVPVYWNFSHALSLYPLPDCLVIGSGGRVDQSPGTFDTYTQCHVVQTTSFSHSGAYATFRPGVEIKDENDTDSDSDDEPDQAVVEFITAEPHTTH